MKIRVPHYFKEFKCIASECEDTCCAGWGIVIDHKTYEKYKNVTGQFGDRLRNEIVHEGGENIFALKGNNCPFLNEDKLCDIYSNLGETGLCYTCEQYPRYTEEFGNLREIGISLSCPEAARIILRDKEKVQFILTENDEELSSYNDINGLLFMELIQCRKIIINLLQNRDLNIDIRLAIVLSFANDIQELIDNNNIQGIKPIKNKYLDKDFVQSLITSFQNLKVEKNKKYNLVRDYIDVFKNLKHITPNDPLDLGSVDRLFYQSEDDAEIYNCKHIEFEELFKDKSYKFENIILYFIFRYMMKAVFDYDLIAKIKTAIVSYIMIKELSVVRYTENGEFIDEDLESVAQVYSKDIEHLEENIESLAEIFEINEGFNVKNIEKALLG